MSETCPKCGRDAMGFDAGGAEICWACREQAVRAWGKTLERQLAARTAERDRVLLDAEHFESEIVSALGGLAACEDGVPFTRQVRGYVQAHDAEHEARVKAEAEVARLREGLGQFAAAGTSTVGGVRAAHEDVKEPSHDE